MSQFNFNENIPAAQNNPSSDQPKMLANNIASFGIIGVDHVGYNTPNGGIHEQTSFEAYATPVLPSGATATAPSVAFPAAGQADDTHAQFYYENPIAIFPLSAIKAYGRFVGNGPGGPTGVIPPTTPLSTYNVVSITQTSGSSFTVILETDVVTGQTPTILVINQSSINIPTYTFTNPNLIINTGTALNQIVNFVVIQI